MLVLNKEAELVPYQPEIAMNPVPPIKILVVDDDKANLMVACMWLDEFGYSYEIARSGNEAIERFKNGDFSMVLMDVRMHDISGYEATKQIRAFEKQGNRRPAHIIALTANALLDDRQKCLNSGMDDYVSKPISFQDLKTKISKHQDLETYRHLTSS